jgi:hypothetical protein
MKNRKARGLVAVVASSLLAGAVGLSVYGRQADAVRWKPMSEWRYWWLGICDVTAIGPDGAPGTPVRRILGLGFVEVQVPYRGPKVVRWHTYRRMPRITGSSSNWSLTGRPGSVGPRQPP